MLGSRHLHRTRSLPCIYVLYIFLLFITGLNPSIASDSEPYQGPILEGTKLEIIRSEEGVVVTRLCADKLLQYNNGDGVYPEGIYVEFYDADSQTISAILTAGQVYYYAAQDTYELKDGVEVKSYEGHKQLHTKKLYWNFNTKEVYTDQFVTIETETELLTGYGLRAKRDLSQYSILAPQGLVSVESLEQAEADNPSF